MNLNNELDYIVKSAAKVGIINLKYNSILVICDNGILLEENGRFMDGLC